MLFNPYEFSTFEKLTWEDMDTIKLAGKEILEQLIELAEGLTNESFTKPLPVLLENSIGKHYRHIIEFYTVMLEGMHNGRINYDMRQHNQELEEDRIKCLDKLKYMNQRFQEPIWQDPIELTGNYSGESEDLFSVSTNAGREMVYIIEHSIHHMAIIRIAIQHEFPEILMKEEFGYAYSTLKHIRQT